jgi:hypothetical protein
MMRPMIDAATNEITRFFLHAIDADLGCQVLGMRSRADD